MSGSTQSAPQPSTAMAAVEPAASTAHVHERAAHVEAFALGAREAHGAAEVEDDPAGDGDEREAVGLGSQDLGVLEPVAVLGGDRPIEQPLGDEGDGQADDVGDHVSGIREQGQRVERHPAGRFDDQETAIGAQRHPQRPPLRYPRYGITVGSWRSSPTCVRPAGFTARRGVGVRARRGATFGRARRTAGSRPCGRLV